MFLAYSRLHDNKEALSLVHCHGIHTNGNFLWDFGVIDGESVDEMAESLGDEKVEDVFVGAKIWESTPWKEIIWYFFQTNNVLFATFELMDDYHETISN